MNGTTLDVPYLFINDAADLGSLGDALAIATRIAIDTETPIDGPRAQKLRVMSVATRDAAGNEQAFVVDARDVDPTLLAPLLRGVCADAWNANFDARVLDEAVWNSTDTTPDLTWWDAQLADALVHQGQTGFSWFHGLAWATKHYLNIEAQGKGTVQLSYTAHDDLTAEQVRYSADDAIETLRVGDKVRQAITKAGLDQICEIEMGARPFLDQMERTGLPFDWPGWKRELDAVEERHRASLGTLADLTGGGQGTLFDQVVEPNWNPASDKQIREALNRWAADEVATWTAGRFGGARDLTDGDSVTAGVLREIGGPLCEALLGFRNNAKILSTYGESIHDHLHDDGRLRPQYLQVVGTNTGRLASRNPNAQNFTPLMKPFLRPPTADRVFVHADLSQAELRFLAQVSEDEPLRTAFRRGVDVHVSTAASMFRFDPNKLANTNPERFKELRQIAKALNFGIAYGTGAATLARSLTANGTPTSKEEGGRLLAQYKATYPGTTAWADARIAEIREIRGQVPHDIDWKLTTRLADSFAHVAAARRSFRSTHPRWPSAAEIVDLIRADAVAPPSLDQAEVEWVLGFTGPVALCRDESPFMFASRTVAGRRQQFNLHVDRIFLEAALEAVASADQQLMAVRARFEKAHDVVLHIVGQPVNLAAATSVFDVRPLRRAFMALVRNEVGDETADRLLTRAAKERVQAMVNAWRNAPIQGGVADIMLVAYADLHRRLARYNNARPVQTVHDSVVVECDAADAAAVADDVREALEQASLRFCPDVTPKADVDIRRSLADTDVVLVAR